MLAEYRFNFTQFNPETPKVDLVVQTAQKRDIAIGLMTPPITRLVKALSRSGAKRVGNKLLSCQAGVVKIAARQSCSAHIQLAHRTTWH